ncbi:MAG: DegT/DnrJ/EryC1/StrS family aminotransferase [Chloroflexi bacterium]|nr:DegT/DnrJ/EryC1/StrS family aminotransferase [Chloroflexota bacterium]MCI0579831.1 DegT/DnrJ/EryC1/StrS family aminotransferase [Chloroflexota bacterium]MCI0646757.1 DegT/DnrJ/EryC1/StrS family aminotransferase [Chloroflexota bacterium]MCI0728980.1 DegT/DnrJ/EryC1/StrS family aminotransferase [Chloroflexota bacterium]
MFRHLPPAATPFTLADLRTGLRPPGQVSTRFREALATYLGGRTCYLASSGRTALYLLLQALSSTSGRCEVILPAYTCPALARVALDLGLRPRLVDVSPETLGFVEEGLAGQITEQTLAIIHVHPFGLPQPLEPVLSLARQAGAVIIEDAAQAMGARLDGQPAGTQGEFSLFSLGPGKPLSTGGGGVLTVNDDACAPLVAQAWATLSAPSPAASAASLLRLALLALAFHPRPWWLSTRLGLHRLGDHQASWGYRLCGLSAAQAAVGLALLLRLEAINKRRRENARQLLAGLRELPFVHLPQPAVASEPIYLRLPLLVDSQERRERLFQRLWAAGIGVGRMYRHSLAHLFPQLAAGPYPGAEQVAGRLLTLPTHHYLTAADVERITGIFCGAL